MTDIFKVRVDAGPVVNHTNAKTNRLAGAALDALSQQIEALAGRDFFGVTSVELAWKDGQIMEVRTPVKPQQR